MKQVVQPISGGPIRVVDVPKPSIEATEVLVQTQVSLISTGTERALTRLANEGILGKARARPDLVRKVVKKARTEGVAEAARAVGTRLSEDLPLGYSAAGRAIEVGEAVVGIAPGQLVATAGAGMANHAEYQAVPGLLCAPVPDGVSAADASFAAVGSIAMHSFRLADVGPGSKVAVIGLGLIGQLAMRIAEASGCDVVGIDSDATKVEVCHASGHTAFLERGQTTTDSVVSWGGTDGVDAVIVAAAGRSSSPVMRAPELCRDQATIVIVGDVGLDLERGPFYERELTLRFARSLGPGRYERSYEEWGVDLPSGYVRWTEGRNLRAVLESIAKGRLQVADLVTHTFDITDAPAAYSAITDPEQSTLGVQLNYPSEEPTRVIGISPPQTTGATGVGLIGAGNFARATLIPGMKKAGFDRFVAVASASGLTARTLAKKERFERVLDEASAVIDDPDTAIIVIATPHSMHADLTARALRAGKHVFCEKPLALTTEELRDVEDAWRASGKVLGVGFNRRWSPAIAALKDHLRDASQPKTISYRVNAQILPPDHWYRDRREGGRLLGEVCHFVDTCNAIVGVDPTSVTALGSGAEERLLSDRLLVTMAYPDGSLATISYAPSGIARAPKETIDVVAGKRSATLIDFRRLVTDKGKVRLGGHDKGHRDELRAFHEAVEGHADFPTEAVIASTRATLRAAESLLKG